MQGLSFAMPRLAVLARAARVLRVAGQSHKRVLETDVVRVVTFLSAVASLSIALAFPTAFLVAAQGRLKGALETSATLHAAEMLETVRRDPAILDFEGLHVSTPAQQARGTAERRRIYDAAGRLVIESGPEEELSWPVMSRRAPLIDEGRVIGQAEAARSIRPALATATLVAAASTLFGGLIFFVLRIIPLEMLRRALERAAYLAAHDMLTGLPNRKIFADRLSQGIKLAQRNGHALAVLCLDLDRFKEVNDTLGHAAGDRLLREIANRLGTCLRESDTLARLGGDEFAIIQPQANQPQDAEVLARRVVAVVEAPVELDGHDMTVGVSIGIALGGSNRSADPLQLLRDADLALYQAKANGRGGWCFFAPEMNQRLVERRAMEADLRTALSEGQFRLFYQPQVDLETGRIIGAEALLRWNRPGFGPVSPECFIPLAEETGLIAPIGAWALQEACRQAASWRQDLSIAVNVSAVQFRLPGLYESTIAALATSGLRPSRLELEITEGVLLSDTGETLVMLNRLHALGVRIAMDDFGTGYSSLGYLNAFTFDKIKIDRKFVQSLGGDANASAIVRAVVGITRTLGMRANAEGVESDEQAALLLAEGCGEGQGFRFGKPMSAEDFVKFIEAAEVQPPLP